MTFIICKFTKNFNKDLYYVYENKFKFTNIEVYTKVNIDNVGINYFLVFLDHLHKLINRIFYLKIIFTLHIQYHFHL
jgi:hypothetical protein